MSSYMVLFTYTTLEKYEFSSLVFIIKMPLEIIQHEGVFVPDHFH